MGPPVELRLNLGEQDYAIEHTRIEAFEGQIRTAKIFTQLIRPVIDELTGTLPGPAVYHIYLPTDANLGVAPAELERVRRDLVRWICKRAQRLHEANPERPTKQNNPRGFDHGFRGRPPGFPYEVTLRREAHWSLSPRHDGILLHAQQAPADIEAERRVRLERALRDKCPKLQRCKDEGARTVLVFEDSDISLSNYVLIGEALAGLLDKRDALPDEIYLLETVVDRWAIRPMKYEDESWEDQGWSEFNKADLADMSN